MIFCRGCGKPIHETAPTCPHCGAVTQPSPTKPPTSKVSLGLSIAAIVLGALTILGLLAEDPTRDTLMGGTLFTVVGLSFSVINLSRSQTRNGLAIAAVIVCAIAALALLGSI